MSQARNQSEYLVCHGSVLVGWQLSPVELCLQLFRSLRCSSGFGLPCSDGPEDLGPLSVQLHAPGCQLLPMLGSEALEVQLMLVFQPGQGFCCFSLHMREPQFVSNQLSRGCCLMDGLPKLLSLQLRVVETGARNSCFGS